MEQEPRLSIQLAHQSVLQRQPKLVLLGLLLGCMPFSAPVARIARDVTAQPGFFLAYVFPFAAATLIASAALIVASRTGKLSHGFGLGIRRAATIFYIVCLAVLYVFSPSDWFPAVVINALSACAAFAFVPILCSWVNMYRTDMPNIMFYGALSCILATLVGFTLSWLPSTGFAICGVVGSIAGCIPAILPEKRDAPSSNSFDDMAESRFETALIVSRGQIADFLSLTWTPFLGLLVCVFMSCASEMVVDGATLRTEFIGALVASVIILVVCLIPHKTPFPMLVEFLVAPVLIAVAVIFGSFQPGEMPFFIGAAVVYAPLLFMGLYALSLLESVVAAGEFAPPFVIGIALSAVSLMMLAGSAANLFIPAETLAPYTWVVACTYFGIAFIHVGYTAWRQITRASVDDSLAVENRAGNNLEAASGSEEMEARWQNLVDELAAKHNLTAREREILSYMSRGYGSGYISKVLFISDNTARTHIRNIYRKVGVHSREELIALFM